MLLRVGIPLQTIFIPSLVVKTFIPRLHDTTSYQTGCTSSLTTGCIV